MRPALNDVEARILGCLVEKSLTTPDQYPLSLNALVNACNQKSSRDPVMNLEEAAVRDALHQLLQKSLAGRLHEPGSRVPKFMHHVEILLESSDAKQIGAACVLLLRGPQTPGELKTRTERLCEFASTAEVESLLQDLAARPEPWVQRLPRQTGQKETRYRHLFCAGAEAAPATPPLLPSSSVETVQTASKSDRVAELEKRVEQLEKAVQSLLQKAGV